MGAIGKTGSFITDTALDKNHVGASMSEVQSDGFKFRAEDYLKQKAKADDKDAKAKKVNDGLEKVKGVSTKFNTLNAFQGDVLQQARNAIGEAGLKMERGEMSQMEFDVLKNNILGQVDQLNQNYTRVNDQVKRFSEMVANGNVPEGFEEDALRLGKSFDTFNMKATLQPNGTFKMASYDEEGNVIEEGDFATIGNNTFTNPVTNVDFDAKKAKFLNSYPKVTNQTIGNNQTNEVKGWSKDYDAPLNEQVANIMADKNAVSILAKKITGKAQRNITDPEILKAVEKGIRDEYKGLYATEKKDDPNYEGSNNALGWANYNSDNTTPAPGFTGASSDEKEIFVTTTDGQKIRVPKGSTKLSVENFVDGDLKKGVYDRINYFQIIKGSDGRYRVIAEAESVGKAGDTESFTEFTEEGKKKIATYQKKNPKLTPKQVLEAVVLEDPSVISKQSTRTKEQGKRIINVGGNFAEIQQFLPSGMTSNDVMREVLRRGGIDPDKAGKKATKKDTTTKVKKKVW